MSAVSDLKDVVAKLATDISLAVTLLTQDNPDVAAAVATLKGLASSLEAAEAPPEPPA